MKIGVYRLAELTTTITKGTTPTSLGMSFVEQGIGFLRVQNINDGEVIFEENVLHIDEKTHQTLKRSQIKSGDVLVSIAGSIGRAAVVPDNAPELNCNQAVAIVRVKEQLFQPYLRYWLESYEAQTQIRGVTVTGTIANLNLSQLGNLQIPLPPIETQKRIAAILNQAEALRSLRRQSIGQLDALSRSVFLEMFGDPATNPKGWDIRKVSDYVTTFQGGKCIDAEDGGTITRNRIVKVSAVTSMVFRPEESKPLPDEYEPPLDHFVKPGDLLFSRANTTELVGAVAYVESTPPNIVLADKVWRFVWKEPSVVEPLFIWSLFQTAAMRYEIGRRATGTSGSMKNISQPKTLGIPTILPPLVLQQEFADRIGAIEALKAQHRESLAKMDSLFASLQHRAFRGEL